MKNTDMNISYEEGKNGLSKVTIEATSKDARYTLAKELPTIMSLLERQSPGVADIQRAVDKILNK
jgi:hypothetical protein